MWGRWSLTNDMGKTLLTRSPAELHKLLNNKKMDIGAISFINDDLVMVPYKRKGEFVTSHPRYNVVLSLFTTSAARVRLYGYMDMVVKDPNSKLLYTGELPPL